jgi:hypothetical protein
METHSSFFLRGNGSIATSCRRHSTQPRDHGFYGTAALQCAIEHTHPSPATTNEKTGTRHSCGLWFLRAARLPCPFENRNLMRKFAGPCERGRQRFNVHPRLYRLAAAMYDAAVVESPAIASRQPWPGR